MNAEKHLARCSLKEAGIRADGVKKFLQGIETGGYHLHSFMLTRHGKVAFECSWAPYRLDEVHLMHSFTKGLVATAIGILEGEGRLSLDDTLVSFFPEYEVNDESGRLKKITIHHLLTMTNGHADAPERHNCDDEILRFLKHPIVYEPGTHFTYDSMGTNMLSAIVKRVTGYNLFHFLQLRIFDPMGITGVYCDTTVTGRDQGGGGAQLKTEDMAKIMILYLNGGTWNGKQLVPRDWVERMTTVQFAHSLAAPDSVRGDWNSGYGYQVWMCQIPNTFRFDGMFGQFGVVLKDYDASIITTCGECNTEEILRLMWKYLVPAMEEEDILKEQEELERELEEYKKTLHIDWPTEHEISSDRVEQLWSKILDRTMVFPENQESVLPSLRVKICYTSTWTQMQQNGIHQLCLKQTEEGVVLEYNDNHNHGVLPVGVDGVPREGLLLSLWGDYRVWTAARWNKDENLELQIRMVTGEYYQVFAIKPDGNQAVINIYSGPWDSRFGGPTGADYLCTLK